MKSPQVQNVDSKNAERYTDLQVCQSGAGFYIGAMYKTPEGFTEPGSRDSQYFPTREEAQKALDSGIWEQRMWP